MPAAGDFMTMISELERIARTKGDCLKMQEIKDYFSDMELADTQLDYICQYFEGKQIYIEDRVERSADEELFEEELTTPEDPMDAEIVEMYMAEAKLAAILEPQQELALLEVAATGDSGARNMLVEANLMLAIEVAREYAGKGMLMSDLIQEANMGLMKAASDYNPGNLSEHPEGLEERLKEYKKQSMRKHIAEALDEYNEAGRSAAKMAARINRLNDLATAYAKEHGKEATPKELAGLMGISEDEVRELMKTSLDAINNMVE